MDKFNPAEMLAPPVNRPAVKHDFDDEPAPQTEKQTDGQHNFLDDYDLNKDTGYGTDSLIKVFNGLPSKTSDNIFDTILVNVSTIVRNNSTLDRDNSEIKKYTEDDVVNLIKAIVAYQEEMGRMLTNPMIVFYLPDYSWIPEMHQRKPSPLKVKINTVVEQLMKDDNIRTKKQIRSHQGNSTIYELFAGGKTELPHQSISKFIGRINTLSHIDPATQLTKYLLISHCPMDYHLLLLYRRMMILESFTGELIPPKRLGFKVFKNNFVPFNSVTHLLFGDPVQLLPMAKRKNRKIIMEQAAREQWYVRTPYEIAQMVGRTGQVDARILTYLKF